MLHQIEKLQKMVNNLLGLCADGEGDAVQDGLPASPQEKKYERLGIMILKAQDGELERRYLLRMEKWLLSDPHALRYYIDFQNLSAMLHVHFNPSRFRNSLIDEHIPATQ